jgi:hypothetical protein
MKFSVLSVLAYLLLGCGIDTSSSSEVVVQNSTIIDTTVDTNNSIDTNSTDTNSTDTNTSSTTTTVVVDDSTTSGYSKTDAEEDVNACLFNDTFQILSDSSFDPNAVADTTNGVDITSQYPYSSDLTATTVVLYYPSLSVGLQNETIHIYEDNYVFSFDKAWSSNELSSVYIRTPKDIYGAYSCYRYDLSSVSGTSISKTKVYR